MSAPLLQLERLSLTLDGRPLLQDLTLQLQAGEVLGLVGASGSGKSLTTLALMGLLPEGARLSGGLKLDGQDLLALPEAGWNRLRGQRVGLVFQEPMSALNPLMSIGAQLAEALRLHRPLSRREAWEQARAGLGRVGLGDDEAGARRHPHQLSGGQRQRVVIAIAMALQPRLLIADEPTTALDVTTQAQILELLTGLVREQGCGLLLVTHDLALVAQVADRVAVLQQGRIVEQGEAVALLSRPGHVATQALVAQAELPPHAGTANAGGEALLEVQGLSRHYRIGGGLLRRAQRRQALSDVSLTVHRGERVGLVGESGSGKSTLLRAVLGLEPTQAGSIRLGGQCFGDGDDRALRRRVQIVFQDPYGSLDPRWPAWRLVAEPLHLREEPASPAEARAQAKHWLERVGLGAAVAERRAHQFSGGQRQRLALARALIVEPELLVLDEAVSALDTAVRAQILTLLDDLCREQGTATLFVSHDLGVMRTATDRLYVLQQGRIVESGPTAQVLSAPQAAYTAQLLADTQALGLALTKRLAGQGRADPT
ncbi:MAG: microcin ABC transporter ATP-binding protein [Roseateles depolymerans]|uniref:Microcin ABC transporter ATP-binding protein n=1 Tax=Roseateles depolymerans TaxID=76731 RepID=A0A2W5E0D9_9BURK|nr:MAG: microcin ABC transporter ATP-binding protein [Roseateles depolymerans]